MRSRTQDHYKANVSLLKRFHPSVWEAVRDFSGEPVGEVVLSGAERPNLLLPLGGGRRLIVHPEEAPESEGAEFLEKVPEDFRGAVCFLGMGMGYAALDLIRKRVRMKHLVLFELEEGIFIQALRHMDLSQLLADPRLILHVGEEPDLDRVMMPARRALTLESVSIYRHPASRTWRFQVYDRIHTELYAHVSAFNVEGATKTAFGREFVDNPFRHLNSIHHDYLLEGLKGVFAGTPAVIVAGGPSLNRNIDLLARAKEGAVLFAVDTVLPPLIDRGITPHFVSSIDYKDSTYEKFAKVVPKIKDTSLICMPWAAPKVVKNFPTERIFWSFTGKPLENWLNSLLGGTLTTIGAASVAQLNFIAATIMGCSPIVFVGQDLAYGETSSHVDNVELTVQDQMKRLLEDKDNLVWVKGYHGGKVPTDRGLFTLKEGFEKMIKNTPGHYINATEGGAHIEGTEPLSLGAVIDLYCGTELDFEGKAGFSGGGGKPLDITNALTAFRTAGKEIRELDRLNTKVEKGIATSRREMDGFRKRGAGYRSLVEMPGKIRKRLVEIDNLNARLDGAEGIWKMLEDITIEGLRQSERKLTHLTRIQSDPDRYMEWLSMNLERLADIAAVRKEVLEILGTNISEILRYHEEEEKLSGGGKSLELARLYFESGDLYLAKKLLEELEKEAPDNGEICFYLGCIANVRTEYEEGERYFKRAAGAEPGLTGRMEAFGRENADRYHENAVQYKKYDRKPYKKMLLKGLRFCGDHRGITEALADLAGEDLEVIGAPENGAFREEAGALIAEWGEDLSENRHLAHTLSAHRAGTLYRRQGELRMLKGDYPGAGESFERALTFLPEDPSLHISMADIRFAVNDFPGGIGHLDSAVALDRKYAGYWENMGDNLFAQGRFKDAVFAFEKCFLALPDRVELLKKIGDSYLEMDLPEAAREAYTQLRNRLVKG